VTRLLYLLSHPIQYQAPLLRRIAREPGIELRVIFGSMATAGVYRDPGFAQDIQWDVPLLEGYESAALATVDLPREIEMADAVWIHGWQFPWQRRAIVEVSRRKAPLLMRGENWAGSAAARAGPVRWLKRMSLRWLFNRCDAFLAIGSRNRDYYLDHGAPAGRIFSVPYAIDNAFFAARAEQARADTAAARARLGLPPAGQIVMFVGKLIGHKRPDLLLEAWRRVSSQLGGATLVFVGDGAMRQGLERAVGERVRFVGFHNQTEMPALYALADLLVLPSAHEAWGLVVNEAMASGTAVIASDAVGAAHDLIDPSCGAMFRAGDAAGLAQALVTALPRARDLGAAAQRRIATWDFEADVRGLKLALSAVGA
jgi:glycosyltransferase involved in cell wall biosynthesis